MTYPEPEAYRETFGQAVRGALRACIPVLVLLWAALWLAVTVVTRAHDRTVDDIRADLATQGCVLVRRDAGEGQTWMVECEGGWR